MTVTPTKLSLSLAWISREWMRVLQLPDWDGLESQTRLLEQFLASRNLTAADVVATTDDEY
jgi:hypothetical protein